MTAQNPGPDTIEIPVDEELFVDIALGMPQPEPFQYEVPFGLHDQVEIGKRVKVRLRHQTRYGYIVGKSSQPKIHGAKLKTLLEITDAAPLVSKPFLDLTHWMSVYYFCSWGQAIETALPAPFKKGRTTMKTRQTAQGPKEYIHASPSRHDLTPDQNRAFEEVAKALERRKSAHFLLHGVTGSGKTEVYLHLIEKLLEEGRDQRRLQERVRASLGRPQGARLLVSEQNDHLFR